MTKAEEAALKAYPVHEGASEKWIYFHLSGPCQDFIKGYEQGMQDMLETAVNWMKAHTCAFKNMDEVDMYISMFQDEMKKQQ